MGPGATDTQKEPGGLMTATDTARQLFASGLAALDAGDFSKAEAYFTETLQSLPESVPTLSNLLFCKFQQRKFTDIVELANRLIAIDKNNIDARQALALAHKELSQHELALKACNELLNIAPRNSQTLNNKGVVLNNLGRHEEAVETLTAALALNPRSADAFLNRGIAQRSIKKLADALSSFDQALSVNANLEGASLARASVLAELSRYPEALAAYDRALSMTPASETAWVGRGNVLVELKRYDEAIAAFDRALAIKSDSGAAWLGRGNVFYNLKRYDEASAAYDKACSTSPDTAEAWLGRGNLFYDLKRYDDAFAAYGEALSVKQDLAEAWLGRGNLFFDLKRHDDAFAAYDKALSIKPDLAEAWLGRGNAFIDLMRYGEAFAAYDKARSIAPDLAGIEGARLAAKMHLCSWDNLDADVGHLVASIRAGKANSPPFAIVSLVDLPDVHLRCAKAWVSAKALQTSNSGRQRSIYKHDKIRIGYVSPDLRQHPVGHLTAGVFENHDVNRFEIYAFSIGHNDNSDLRHRLEKSFHRFIDCYNKGDTEIADLIKTAEIDILVDLAGHTQGARPSLFGGRSAPIQVNYLGYPGTMGAEFMDYILGDRVIFQDASTEDYSEKLVRLPDSVVPYDIRQHVAQRSFTREECHLPDEAVVLCCFNSNNKILPEMFDSWMRILKRVDGSVIWLFASNQIARENLKQEAARRSVDPARLVFADRIALPDHLARQRLADLFLDTLPHNAITTASDALWTGLPVLTRMGQSFASRGAASLLNAVGLPELVAHSREDYELRAIELALDRDKIKAIKERLARNLAIAPLFDVARYTRHLEAAYEAMHRRHHAGLPPDHIEIGA